VTAGVDQAIRPAAIDAADVVVIGAGAFGAAVAYHLARAGRRRVALLDRFALGGQTSPRAAGLTSQVRATDTLTRLARRAVQQLETFSRDTGQPLRLDQSGALKIARTDAHVAQLEREVARGRKLGLPVEIVSAADARRRLPVLEPAGIRAITFNPTDCNIEPSQLAIGYCRAAEALGVATFAHTAATGVDVARGAVTGVRTDRGAIRTETVVDAAGAWSRLVAEWAGVRLPVVPTRHQLLVTEPIPGITPAVPIARVIDANVYVRHERGGLMLGGYEARPRQYDVRDLGPAFQMADLELDLEVLRGLARSVREQFPVFQDPALRIAEHRGGLPTMTIDDRYVAGPVPGVRGLWVLSGCCVGGLSISPALGEAVAHWIAEGQPPFDLSEISLERFAGRPLPEDELRELCRRAYATHYSTRSAEDAPLPARP
jgi:glycine/D-amino acid oxidase-like deaminating enzyme